MTISYNSLTLLRTSYHNTIKLSRTLLSSAISPPVAAIANNAYAPTVSLSSNGTKLGVLLLNLGGPETMKDVEGFLYNLFADPDIIRLPSFLSLLQKPVAYVISKRRAPKSSEAYMSIGGGSPIVKYTQAQALKIQEKLVKNGYDAKCYFAMRYWNPYTEEVLEQMHHDGVNTMVIVPLYPQYSISTSGSSLKLLQEIFVKRSDIWSNVAHTVVPAWYYRPGYISVMAKLIIDELQHYTAADMTEGLHVLFSAHGVPQSYIEAGDPYKQHIEECVQLISKEIAMQLGNGLTRPSHITKEQVGFLIGNSVDSENSIKSIKIHLSYQSRVGPVQWLKPYTEDILEELGHAGVKNLIVVPVSFVSEHIETLEEIDMEYKEIALECGVKNWRRVPALNTCDSFISDMTDLVVDALQNPSLSISEAASQEVESSSSGSNGGIMSSSYSIGKGDKSKVGINTAEILNGRAAMLGLVGTSILELVAGHPIVSIVGMR